MKDSIINEQLLINNINLLKLYAEEEKKKYNLIFEKFDNCLSCYKTNNRTSLKSKEDNLKSNVSTIFLNRQEYTRVLEEVISKYKNAIEFFMASARKEGKK